MRQYAILKNVVRGVNFGVVVKSHGHLKFYGWSEKGIEWAQWANQNKADLTQLPANISLGEFKGMSDDMMKKIILNADESTAAGESIAQRKHIAFNLGSEWYPNVSKYPSFVDSPIRQDWTAKAKSVNFKAKNFRKEVAHNEIALKVRMHELAFDNNVKQFVAKPNRATKTYVRSEIQQKISRGSERKFGRKIVEFTNKEINKNSGLPTIKRDALGSNTKEIIGAYTKASLGRSIGRAVRSTGRAMTPDRRTRGVASRFISGVLDPRKRRDVDGDGMIFDGTWREMPDPSRFTRKPEFRDGLYRPDRDGGGRIEPLPRRIKPTDWSSRPGDADDGEYTLLSGSRRNLRSSSRTDTQRPRSLRSSTADKIIDSAEGANEGELVSALRKYQNGTRLNSDEREYLLESLRNILDNNPDITEDERVELIDLDKRVRGEMGKTRSLRSNQSRSLRSSATNRAQGGEIGKAKLETNTDRDDFMNNVVLLEEPNRSVRANDPTKVAWNNGLEEAIDKIGGGKVREVYVGEGITAGNIIDAEFPGADAYYIVEGNDGRFRIAKGSNRQTPPKDGYGAPIDNPKFDTDFGDYDTIEEARERIQSPELAASLDDLRENERLDDAYARDLEEQFGEVQRGRGLRSGGQREPMSQEDGVRILRGKFNSAEEELDWVNKQIDAAERAPIGSQSLRLRDFYAEQDMLKKRKKYLENLIERGGEYDRDKGPGRELEKDPIQAAVEEMRRQLDSGTLPKLPARRQTNRPWAPDGGWLRGDGRSLRSTRNTQTETERFDDVPDTGKIYGKLSRNEPLTDDERNFIEQVANTILDDPNSSESERDAMIDLQRMIEAEKANTREFRRQFSERQALYSRGRTTNQPMSLRRMSATTERAARPRGTTLRSTGGDASTRTPVPKTGASRGPGVGPGGKFGHGAMERKYGRDKSGKDGQLWESLTPEQKKAVEEAITAEKKAIDNRLKKFFNKYWSSATKKGSKKQGVVAAYKRGKGKAGGRYEVRPEDDPLDSTDVSEMLLRLDQAVANGDIEKFEVSDKDSRELKLGKDGTAAIDGGTNGYGQRQKALDDAQTILNMVEDGDFSALEHLHPTTKKKIAAAIKKSGGEVPAKWADEVSTVAGYAGGEQRRKAPDAIDLKKERGISEKKKEKRLSLFQRLRRMDPERERAIELRAARRRGGVREGIALDPELAIKKRKLRARAMKRTMLSRFRKSRNADDLASDSKARKDEVGVIKTNPADNTVEVSDAFVDLLFALDNDLIGIQDKKRKGATEKDIENEHKTLLKRLWENAGFAETPTLVKEDEVKALLDAGWQVMIRGTGHEKVDSESYVERFLTQEGRFIPGQGGSAYGIGEYFAYPGEWEGYHGSGPDDRHTIIALIPPTADVMMRSEIEREHSRMRDLTDSITQRLKVLGGRDAVKAREPEELVAEIDAAVPDLASDTSRSGQIVKQLRDRLEALSKMPKNTPEEQAKIGEAKEKLLSSIDYLSRFSKQRSPEMIAPIIGVDVIDTNNGSGMGSPMLLHNRTILATFQTPATKAQADAMTSDANGARRPKAWTSWTRNAKQAGDTTRRPRRSRNGRNQSTPTQPSPQQQTPQQPSAPSAPSTPNAPGGPVNTDSWKSSTPPTTGSNPAKMLTAPDGTRYYTKLRKNGETTQQAEERMQTEVLASKLYELAGVPTADLQMGTNNNEPVMLSRMLPNVRMPRGTGDNDEARKGFVVDAWLANWDAPLNDNIMIDGNGNAVRIDVGGSLDFRAQGARKGSGSTPFGPVVGEMNTMQKNGTYNFTNMDAAELKRQAQGLSTITDDDIRKTVSAVVTDPARAKQLADTLIKRRDNIVKNYG